MKSHEPIKNVQVWQPRVAWEKQADGTTHVWQEGTLPDYPRRLSDRILHWAAVAPERIWMAEREAAGGWQSVTYGQLGALLIPFRPAMERLVPGGEALADAQLFAHPTVRSRLAALLANQAARATGSSTRIARAMILVEPLQLDHGEVTDKGSVNQRAVLNRRSADVDRLYDDHPSVIHARMEATE